MIKNVASKIYDWMQKNKNKWPFEQNANWVSKMETKRPLRLALPKKYSYKKTLRMGQAVNTAGLGHWKPRASAARVAVRPSSSCRRLIARWGQGHNVIICSTGGALPLKLPWWTSMCCLSIRHYSLTFVLFIHSHAYYLCISNLIILFFLDFLYFALISY